MKVAVITTAAGRHDHLRLQLAGLAASTRGPDEHVVVSMADPAIADICASSATVLQVRKQDGRLPVAAARNAGATHAVANGANLLIFLDVDCVPDPGLLARYETVAGQEPAALWSGPVAYLPPPPPAGYVLEDLPRMAAPHAGRPVPANDEMVPLDHTLFWSLSFAIRTHTWSRIGGFYAGYSGYGGEDTDFAQLAHTQGVPHLNVGGALAYHQWHPAPDPPQQHLHDIVRNGRIFRDRWGWWPMTGWLDAFARLGHVTYDDVSDEWTPVDEEAPEPTPTPIPAGNDYQ